MPVLQFRITDARVVHRLQLGLEYLLDGLDILEIDRAIVEIALSHL